MKWGTKSIRQRQKLPKLRRRSIDGGSLDTGVIQRFVDNMVLRRSQQKRLAAKRDAEWKQLIEYMNTID
jgi:hypothetical protein